MTLVPIFSNRFKGRVQPRASFVGLWSETLTVVHLTIGGNTVVIGATVAIGAEKLRVVGSGRFEGVISFEETGG